MSKRRPGIRAETYLEAVAYLVFTGDVAAAEAYLEKLYPDLAEHCRLRRPKDKPPPVLSQEAGMLILTWTKGGSR
jgi:hypothetical protein